MRGAIRLFIHLAVCGVVGVAAADARAQCTTQWLPGWPTPGILQSGSSGAPIRVLKSFDPDGDGPLGQHLLAAGGFINIEGWPITGLAVWNGQEWTAPAPMPTSSSWIQGVEQFNGEYHAAGSFGAGVSYLARYNGAQWVGLGAGVNGDVRALAVYDGALIAGGVFTAAGGVPGTRAIARWDGSAWSSLGNGVDALAGGTASVEALFVHDGRLFVGGNFTGVSGVATNDAATWTTAGGWQAITGNTNPASSVVKAFTVHEGSVYGAGWMTDGAGVGRLAARYSAGAWEFLPGALTSGGPVNVIVSYQGKITVLGSQSLRIDDGSFIDTAAAAWDGAQWSAMNDTVDPLGRGVVTGVGYQCAVVHNNKLVMGGLIGYRSPGDISHLALLTWDGIRWGTFATGFDANAGAMALDSAGNVVLHGTSLAVAGGRRANMVAWCDGQSVQPMGSGLYDVMPDTTFFLAAHDVILHDAEVYVCGNYNWFSPSCGVFRWNGSDWVEAIQHMSPRSIRALENESGSLFAAGDGPIHPLGRSVIQHSGSGWTATGEISANVADMRWFRGDLYAGVSPGPNRLWRWNGQSTWAAVPGFGSYQILRMLSWNDRLIFLIVDWAVLNGRRSCVLEFDGATLRAVGDNLLDELGGGNTVGDLIAYNGDLIASRSFLIPGTPNIRTTLVRFDGIRWSPVPGAPSGKPPQEPAAPPPARAHRMLVRDGVLWVSGTFNSAGGHPSPYLARYVASGAPQITLQPEAAAVCPGGGAVFSMSVADASGVEFRWRRNRELLNDGPHAGGGTIAGAATPTLTLTGVAAVDAGGYDCIATTQCGTAYTVAAALTVQSACCDSIDFNGDGLFPDNQDLVDFVTVFGGGACSNDPNCADIDFNNDGLFPDNEDIFALFRVFGGGECGL
jgi:hypothetical protein